MPSSSLKRRSTSTKSVPLTGSPPMPTQVLCPIPSAVSCPTASYVRCPRRLMTPTRPGLWMCPGMMPILQAPGVITPGQFGPTRRVFVCASRTRRTRDHVADGDALGDRDDESATRVDRLEDRVRGERRRHEDARRRSRPSRCTRVDDGVEHGRPCPRTSRRRARASRPRRAFVPYSMHLLRVECPGAAGDPLNEEARALVDEDGHVSLPSSRARRSSSRRRPSWSPA